MSGLLLKFVDGVVLIHVHDAEAGGLLHGDLQHRDGGGSLLGLVVGQHLSVVHLINVVTGQNQHIVGIVLVDEVDILIDGIGRTLEPGAHVALLHIGGQNMQTTVGTVQIPGLSVAQIGVQLQRLILGQHADRVNAGIDAVGQWKVDDAVLPAEGDGGLGHMAGQSVQARSLSAGQQHGNHFLFHTEKSPLAHFMQKRGTGSLRPVIRVLPVSSWQRGACPLRAHQLFSCVPDSYGCTAGSRRSTGADPPATTGQSRGRGSVWS